MATAAAVARRSIRNRNRASAPPNIDPCSLDRVLPRAGCRHGRRRRPCLDHRARRFRPARAELLDLVADGQGEAVATGDSRRRRKWPGQAPVTSRDAGSSTVTSASCHGVAGRQVARTRELGHRRRVVAARASDENVGRGQGLRRPRRGSGEMGDDPVGLNRGARFPAGRDSVRFAAYPGRSNDIRRMTGCAPKRPHSGGQQRPGAGGERSFAAV